ncbi:MAG TPA: ABC transporter permease, partial [Verrucomicrobiales bacterium]|nr:ABC transporter permease [Verrucomicrobiales bacterium]
ACALFGLIPLLGVRRVSPLAAIRSSFETSRRTDVLLWLVFLAIGLFILGFTLTHTRRTRDGVGFAVGLGIAFSCLWLCAKGVAVAARKLTPGWLPFVWRQGLANLHRPNNRTTLLLLSVGLGTFLILTLHLTQHSLLKEIVAGRAEGQANAILFDIQPDQRAELESLLQANGFPVIDAAP